MSTAISLLDYQSTLILILVEDLIILYYRRVVSYKLYHIFCESWNVSTKWKQRVWKQDLVPVPRCNSSKETFPGCAGNCQYYNSHHTRGLFKGTSVPAKRFNSPKEKCTGCAGRTVLETVNVTIYELLYIYALWHPYT